MKLTKQQAIQEHRKMWNWIADQYKTGNNNNVYTLKAMYKHEEYPKETIWAYCFCCDFAWEKEVESCRACPVIWGADNEVIKFMCEFESIHELNGFEERTGLYAQINRMTHKKDFDNFEAERLAREIANLPERED